MGRWEREKERKRERREREREREREEKERIRIKKPDLRNIGSEEYKKIPRAPKLGASGIYLR